MLLFYFVTYYDKLVFNYVTFHRSLLKIAFGEVTWLNIKLTNTYSRQSTSLQPYAPYVFLFCCFILRRKCAMQASWSYWVSNVWHILTPKLYKETSCNSSCTDRSDIEKRCNSYQTQANQVYFLWVMHGFDLKLKTTPSCFVARSDSIRKLGYTCSLLHGLNAVRRKWVAFPEPEEL